MVKKKRAKRPTMSRTERMRFAEAGMLADFANLKDASTTGLRHDSGFLPDIVWIGSPEAPWRLLQRMLRDGWQQQFPAELSVKLISTVAEFSKTELYTQAVSKAHPDSASRPIGHDEAWLHAFKLEGNDAIQMLQNVSKPVSFSFQNAVMYLTLQPWRAQICTICQRYWVKSAPRDRYCSPECSKKAILRTKRVSASKHGHWR